MNVIEPMTNDIPKEVLVMGVPACPPEATFHHRWHTGRRVEIAAFKLGRYPVTNLEYRAYLADTGAKPPAFINAPGFSADHQPVGAVSWLDSVAFCSWLVQRTSKGYRLPTDAEWEHAARGGNEGTCFAWGDELSPDKAWYGGQATTKEAGQYPANGFGLFDMTGNVWEWCADRFEDVSGGLHAIDNPIGKPPSDNRVLRGGSFLTKNPMNLWLAYRHEDPPELRHECIGFRVALSLGYP